ncbi:MAG: hypothetical protein AB7W59_08295 [Acidimicrobiia bacterium]
MQRRARLSALAAAGALTLAACGGSGGGDGADTAAATPAGPAVAGPAVAGPAATTSPLPSVNVVDVVSGDTVQLAGLLPAAKPTLVWMWAPH